MQMFKRIYYFARSFEKEVRVKYYRQVGDHRFMWSLIQLVNSFKRLQQASAALTYHTVFAIVPVLSLMIAVAKGLGYDEQFKIQLQSLFQGQDVVSDKLLMFAGSYLNNTQNVSLWWGVGIGVILLLYSIFSIFRTIDTTFNMLWNVEGRSLSSLLKTFAFVMMIPFIVIIGLGLWWSISSFFNGTAIHEINVFIASVVTYVAVLFCIYKLIPKTKVKVKYAVLSALVCGLIFATMQYFGYAIVSMFNSYRNVYGDLATMIIFLLWIYFSWTICLAGSKWNYFLQKVDEQAEVNNYKGISHNYQKFLSLLIIERIESVYPFSGGFTFEAVAENVKNVYGVPSQVTLYILERLNTRRIILGVRSGYYMLSPKYSECTVGYMIDMLDSAGRNVDRVTDRVKSEQLDLLWRLVDGECTSDNIHLKDMPVREILTAKALQTNV